MLQKPDTEKKIKNQITNESPCSDEFAKRQRFYTKLSVIFLGLHILRVVLAATFGMGWWFVAATVRPDGKTEVAFESGHPMLKQAALDSAEKSRFECRECDSTATYQLVYSFRLAKGSDCCSAMSVPARVTLEPQRSDQNIQQQAHITIAADEICLCDPPAQLTKKSRSLKCLYLWKCS
jgi:hypothetical protein